MTVDPEDAKLEPSAQTACSQLTQPRVQAERRRTAFSDSTDYKSAVDAHRGSLARNSVADVPIDLSQDSPQFLNVDVLTGSIKIQTVRNHPWERGGNF